MASNTSFILFAEPWCQSWPHIKAYFRLQDHTDCSHDPDLGIKKVIAPIFMPLKPRKWFNDHSLISNESLFHHKSRDEISWRGEGCNTRCYCSSYNTSTIVSTLFIQWWLQYKPNSMKMVFSTNGVGSFWVNLKVWIFELLGSVDHWAQSTICRNLMEWN
jgi:hypothetical protein